MNNNFVSIYNLLCHTSAKNLETCRINHSIDFSFLAFVCEHKDTTIFGIQKIIIYLCRKYQDY